MGRELDELLEDAGTAGVTLVTSFVRLGDVAPPRWTVMIRAGGEIQTVGLGDSQEEALYEALHRAGLAA